MTRRLVPTDDEETLAWQQIISVISFFKEALCSRNKADLSSARFRKFATDPEYRSLGIGSKLLTYSISQVKDIWGASEVWCDARVMTRHWYQRRGFREVDENGADIDLDSDGSAEAKDIPQRGRFWKGEVEYVRMKIDL
ncbi:hypothetical protein FRC03_010491 [Tulasnella sp. 419]|nr:hypothetical protein FRC03_010491 [Tulasnella sp. 419]